MKNCVIVVFILCTLMMMFTQGCTEKKPQAEDTIIIVDTPKVATRLDTMSELISEEPMPYAADELFDDFIFNFAANSKLQKERILFPLKLIEGETTQEVDSSEWKMDYFFMEQGYYTLLFDDISQLDIVKDTSINQTVVEKIFLAKENMKKYVFERLRGRWMLTLIEESVPYDENNESFLTFYKNFATDVDFQLRSLNDPVMFTGPDPDDDFSTMTGEIAPETWPAFAPELPSDILYNITYGQKYTEGDKKVFVIRGIANGLEIELFFKRILGDWKLEEIHE
ncbi:MAG: DUF4348 domain-containing protein [Prevotella sp.]|nr:DUF4348 domain-containing protein [Prevotella sp.]